MPPKRGLPVLLREDPANIPEAFEFGNMLDGGSWPFAPKIPMDGAALLEAAPWLLPKRPAVDEPLFIEFPNPEFCCVEPPVFFPNSPGF